MHERLARGGMGTVYRAEQRPLGRACALKVVVAGERAAEDPAFRERFFREAAVLARLSHPNTVTVFDYGQSDGVLFIAMRLVTGRTLHRVVREDGPLAPGRLVAIARQIAGSLGEAHALGIVHRDLKPANVMLDARDTVTVLDFGLAKPLDESNGLTRAGVFLGSPRHMAPEQVRGDAITPATDVYALGATLYELLAGHAPFERPSPIGTMVAHLSDPVPPLARTDVPDALAAIVMRCLAKSPDARFAGMNAVISALDAVGDSALHAEPTHTTVLVRPPLRRSRVALAAVLLGVVATGLGMVAGAGNAADTLPHAALR